MRKFVKNNQGFSCLQCGEEVPVAASTCRNHCPFCLYSLHVDVFPGDRLNTCRQLMRPFAYDRHKKKGLRIWFECTGCGAVTKNIALCEDAYQGDEMERILQLRGWV